MSSTAVVNARKTLDAGFTSVRDVGSLPFLAVDLRNSISEGLVPGPRIVASGPGISITGGHGDLFLTLQIVLPPSISEDEQMLYERLSKQRHPDPRMELLYSSQRR